MTAITANTSATSAPAAYTTNTVTSRDGTLIAYRQLGHGPGLVLVQGTMGTAQHFMELATLLSDSFTVYVPDRRGRGDSGAGEGTYSLQKEVEDLDALLNKTGAHYVFGLSAGAIVSLQAALTLSAIHRVIIFEPPLFLNGAPMHMLDRYEKQMAEGSTAAALVTAMKASKLGPEFFMRLPDWLLVPLINMSLRQEDKKGAGNYPTMRELAGTLHNDFHIVGETSGHQERFGDIHTDVLLMGGSTSPDYLKSALAALEKIIPNVRRVELPGVGHAAPWNSDKFGSPAPVAEAIRQFFMG